MLGFDALGSSDDQDVRSVHEEAGLDDARNVVQRHFQLARLFDAVNVDIHNQIARLGFKWGTVSLPEYHPAFRERFDLARRTAPAKWDYFDREREGSPHYRNSFCMVDHDDELPG